MITSRRNTLYIPPHARSVFEQNKSLIHKAIMDTTRRDLRTHVCAILMMSIANDRLLVVFSLRLVEDMFLDDKYFRTADLYFRIPMNDFPKFSDLDSVLHAVCSRYKFRSVIFLRSLFG
jgi:hypothetical protein